MISSLCVNIQNRKTRKILYAFVALTSLLLVILYLIYVYLVQSLPRVEVLIYFPVRKTGIKTVDTT